jgi:major membrane immunogen (membrane-anchored lipoprotein)
MLKKGITFFILFFLSFVFLSCDAGDPVLKDGYYTACTAEFDSYGWKEYITIRVSDGRVIVVEYNAFNPSGFIKSWDMDYMRVMNATDGTYPSQYTRYYGSQFLALQKTDGIEALSGATTSYYIFLRLADAALENARWGKSESTLVYIKEDEHAEE